MISISARINQIQNKINRLDQILKDQSYMGCGIKIDLCVGVSESDSYIADMELCQDVPFIIKTIRDSLHSSLLFNIQLLTNEIKEGQKTLDKFKELVK